MTRKVRHPLPPARWAYLKRLGVRWRMFWWGNNGTYDPQGKRAARFEAERYARLARQARRS